MPVDLAVRVPGSSIFAGSGVYQTDPQDVQAVTHTVSPGESFSFELQIRNDATERFPGDARATPLLRAAISGGDWHMACTDAEGKDITRQLLAQGAADGYFVGGLNPKESRIVRVTISSPAKSSPDARIRFDLYWNPQDPASRVRDAVAVTLSLKP